MPCTYICGILISYYLSNLFCGLVHVCVCSLKVTSLKVVTKHNVLLFESLFTVSILNVFVFKPSN